MKLTSAQIEPQTHPKRGQALVTAQTTLLRSSVENFPDASYHGPERVTVERERRLQVEDLRTNALGSRIQTTTSTRCLPTMDQSTLEILLTEILGVSPQVLLDDYTNIGHENVRHTIEGVEGTIHEFINLHEPPLPPSQRERYLAELESGTIALQTLIDSHADFSFDLFEVWTWRNLFTVPEEAAKWIVVPHQKGLDLTISESEEQETRDELALLRRRLEAVSATPTVVVNSIKFVLSTAC